MNDLRTLPASDTFRIRSGMPKQGQKAFPMDGVVVQFWMGLDAENEAAAFHVSTSEAGGDVTVVLEQAGDTAPGIYVEVPANKVATCIRERLYYWKVRVVTPGEGVFTIDAGCVKFSDKVQ